MVVGPNGAAATEAMPARSGRFGALHPGDGYSPISRGMADGEQQRLLVQVKREPHVG